MADTQLPPGWKVLPVTDLFDRLPVGKKYDQWSISPGGKIPILDQSPDGIFGYHDEEPGIDASPEEPVVTFSNHRCYVRLITFPFSTIQNVIPMRCRSGTDPRFFYYAIKNRVPITEYKGHWPEFEILTILLPPIPEQQAIACILGALDDKIELNRQMSRSLEEIARAIFKSWFVDFDPVQAKAEGSDPGLPKHIADLFPDSFQDSELGEIPEGWEASTIGRAFNLTLGHSPPGSTYNESGDGLPFFQGRRDFGFRFPTRRVYCTAPTRFAQPGDALVSVRAPVGDVNMAIEECAVGRGIAAVRHQTGSRSLTYYAMLELRARFNRFEADGTVFGCINKADFQRLPFVEPRSELAVVFEEKIGEMDERIYVSEQQSRTLASLRDALLPKLISGELRIPDAERIIGRAV